MIEINLKPGAKRSAAKRGPAFAGLKSQFAELTSGVKDPWAIAAGVACVVVALGLGGLFLRTSSQRAALEPQIEEARAEQARYQGFLREKRRAEAVRDSILTQIGTIASVDRNRYIWPHILDEVQSALPEMTWLLQLAQIGGGTMTTVDAATGESGISTQPVIRITGRTGDLQRYTAFLRQLEASPWIENVLPVQAKTIVDGNRALTEFIIQATFSQADSSYVRTVPILESVVED
jgi:Tfp pilus assembly protein PilN